MFFITCSIKLNYNLFVARDKSSKFFFLLPYVVVIISFVLGKSFVTPISLLVRFFALYLDVTATLFSLLFSCTPCGDKLVCLI